ncbi:MAG: hypothetical protein K2W82_16255 [Candidatus Obscuribacterales bacterium]|nr:hypothetical protein [Candidatus Obscuribacterales bacterium]
MVDFFMTRILPASLAVVLLWLFCLLGACIAGMALPGGPGSVVIWAAVTALLLGWISLYLGEMVWEITYGFGSWSSAKTAKKVYALLAVLCVLYSPLSVLLNGHRQAAFLRQTAPEVQTVALARFDEIDTDKNGLLTDSEFKEALDGKLKLSSQERALLGLLQNRLAEAGHVIDSYPVTTQVWISTDSNGGGYFSPIVTTQYIYGINHADLESYSARTLERYKNW